MFPLRKAYDCTVEFEYMYAYSGCRLLAPMGPYIRYLYRAGVVHGLNGIGRGSALVFPGCLKVRGLFFGQKVRGIY